MFSALVTYASICARVLLDFIESGDCTANGSAGGIVSAASQPLQSNPPTVRALAYPQFCAILSLVESNEPNG